MKGVTILQKIVKTDFYPGWDNKVLFCILGVVIIITLTTLIALDFIPKFPGSILLLSILIVISFGFGIFFTATANREETVYYQVLLNDNVVMSDFIDNYTIVEQKGITFIVKPVEDEEDSIVNEKGKD